MKTYIISISGVTKGGNALIPLTKVYGLDEASVVQFRESFNVARECGNILTFETSVQGGVKTDVATVNMADFAFVQMGVFESLR